MTGARAFGVLAVVQALVSSQIPVLLAGRMFLPGLPIPAGRLAVAATVSLLVAALWLATARRDVARLPGRASAYSLLIILLGAYPAATRLFGISLASPADTTLAVAYLVAVPFIIWLALLAWRAQEQALLLIVSVLVIISAVAVWNAGWGAYVKGAGDAWKGAAQWITTPVPLGGHAEDDPDILHIIVDGFGRPQTLEADYGVAASRFDGLAAAGLHIAPDGVANYSHTYQSLASMLNMQYLASLSEPLSTTEDRRPLVQLVQHSAVVQSLKSRGYEIVLVGSGFDEMPEPLADACINCGPTVPGLFETALLSISPFRALGLWRWLFDAHRARITGSVDRLLHMPPSVARPRFLLAHLMVPHPPFLLGPDGARRNPSRAFDILDEALYTGSQAEYIEGYADQASYALKAIGGVVAHARLPGRRELFVVVHGDHGSGLFFDPVRLTARGLRERMTILLASSWPDGQRHEELRSPVNIYRAAFRTLFHARVELLTDRSFVQASDRPYVFQDVTDRVAALEDDPGLKVTPRPAGAPNPR